jgi:tetratricopeptide (TPR) repeat protein
MTVTPDPPRDADHHGSPGPGEEPTAGHQPSSLGATELEKAAAAPSSAGTTTQPATPSHAFAAAPVDVGSSTPSGVTTGPTPAPYHQRPAPPRVPDHPQAPPTAHALDEPRSGVIRNTLIGAAALFGIFLNGLASDLLAGTLSDSPTWAPVQHLLRVLSGVIVVVLLAVWLLGAYLRRRRPVRQLDSDLVAPGPPTRPAWFRPEPVTIGRAEVVRQAVDVVLRRGVVAIVGAPRMGTSTVAHAVVSELIRQGHANPAHTAPFDVRGWSTERPDDATTIAGHLLRTFGASEPLSGSEQVMDDAAARLLERLAAQGSTLVLDNVSSVDQVAWLTRRWPSDGSGPLLVVALSHDPGSLTLADGFPAESIVPLAPLEIADLRQLWRAEIRDERWDPYLDDVLRACDGRPGAVWDLVQELTRPGADIWHREELVDRLQLAAVDPRLRQATSVVDPPARVWYAIVGRTHPGMSRRARRLARALADLPVAELTVEAMEAVRRGLDEDADNSAEGEPERAEYPHLVDPLHELTARNLVRQSEAGRYRMPREIRVAVRAIVTDDKREALRAALPSLVRRYAHLAERWRGVLDSRAHAASAARWFQAEEPFLRALVTASYPDEPGETDEPLLTLVIDDLATLTDALDVWYVRQGQVLGARVVHSSFGDLAERAGRPDLAMVAETRCAALARATGQFEDAAARLERVRRQLAAFGRSTRRTAWALRARLHHEQAQLHLARADQYHAHTSPTSDHGSGATDPLAAATRRDVELRAAERELQHAWAALPKKDTAGEITTLLSMAVVYLHQGAPERALDRLDLAETRAQDAEDATALAHVAELRGIAAWMQGRAPVAVALWQRAMTRFSELADHQGEARCLQHLGSAVLVAPELASLLVGDQRRPLDEVTAVRHAYTWLQRAQRLVAGQPESPIGRRYLDLARERVGHSGGLAQGGAEGVAEDHPARTDTSDDSDRRGWLRQMLGRLGRRLLA